MHSLIRRLIISSLLALFVLVWSSAKAAPEFDVEQSYSQINAGSSTQTASRLSGRTDLDHDVRVGLQVVREQRFSSRNSSMGLGLSRKTKSNFVYRLQVQGLIDRESIAHQPFSQWSLGIDLPIEKKGAASIEFERRLYSDAIVQIASAAYSHEGIDRIILTPKFYLSQVGSRLGDDRRIAGAFSLLGSWRANDWKLSAGGAFGQQAYVASTGVVNTPALGYGLGAEYTAWKAARPRVNLNWENYRDLDRKVFEVVLGIVVTP